MHLGLIAAIVAVVFVWAMVGTLAVMGLEAEEMTSWLFKHRSARIAVILLGPINLVLLFAGFILFIYVLVVGELAKELLKQVKSKPQNQPARS